MREQTELRKTIAAALRLAQRARKLSIYLPEGDPARIAALNAVNALELALMRIDESRDRRETLEV